MAIVSLKTGAAVGAVAILAAAAVGLNATGAAEPGTTAIVGATIFEATGKAPYVGTVVIKGERIIAVGPTVKAPRGARIIRAEGEALVPGFYDVHTHWTQGGTPAQTPEIATAYVASGVTTVNDFHRPPEAFAPVRAWLAKLTTPHVNMTARISTPAGHGAWADENMTRLVNTPDTGRWAVQQIAPYKPDAIKAFTDGWRYGVAPDNSSMDVRTLAALVDEAHKLNLPVLTHTVTVTRGGEAGVAKVDIIAHSLQDRPVDEAAIAAIKAGGGSYAPTLAVYEPVKPGRPAPRNMDDPAVKQRFKKFDYALQNVKTLHDAGVTIALGTDAGMPGTPHGPSSLREMELFVKAGLTPTEALMAGTVNSAKFMRQDKDRGTIQPGKRADLVLIKGKPWVDITDVRKTDRVFIDGKLVFGPGSVANPLNRVMTLPPVPASQALIDDFERPDGRTALDTLRTDNPDSGLDRAIQVTQIIDRGPGHALNTSAKLPMTKDGQVAVVVPLSRGGVTPMDARAFKGVKLDIRGGKGTYKLAVRTTTERWAVEAPATGEWTTVQIPFSSLKAAPDRGEDDGPAKPSTAVWTGGDILAIEVTGQGEPNGKIWYQIDNLAFY